MSYRIRRIEDGRVEIKTGDLSLFCDPKYGGQPLSWKYRGVELIEAFGGSGSQATWQLGQDPTPASANGPCQNPIAQLNGVNKQFSYYGRETILTSDTYQIDTYCPYFWLSFDAEDDSIPNEGIYQWCTKYNNFLGYPEKLWISYGTPIFFRGSKNKPAGTFWVGHDRFLPNSKFWSNRLAPIANGNIAFKTRISFKQSSSDSIAGLMFRKNIPPSANEPAAYYAPGYHFVINKKGYWSLHQLPSDKTVASGRVNIFSRNNLTRNGALLEIRTSLTDKKLIQLYCDGNLLKNYTDENNLLGNYAGLFASCNEGIISFSERGVYDLNYYLRMYASFDEDDIVLMWRMIKSKGVIDPLSMYRCNMGIFFFKDNSTPYGYTRINDNPQHNPGIVKLSVGDKLQMVNLLDKCVVTITPTALNKDFAPAQFPHCLLATTWKPNQPVIGVNTLPVEANEKPVPVVDSYITYKIRVDPL